MQQYDQFVDKFKPRHTSDDTHTPPNVYEAVLSWCERRYGVERSRVVRPFFPGGDYAHAEYPADCVVIDNPPFSRLAEIVKHYLGARVPFFLFAPSLTSICHARHSGCAAVFSDSDITFDNGAVIRCAFLTSLEPADVLAVSAPDLGDAIAVAENENRAAAKKHVTPLALPDEVLTAARMQYLAAHHVPHTVRRSDVAFVRRLDNYPPGIYGGGYLLSDRASAERVAAELAAAERAAAERAAAKKVELSDRERAIVRKLGDNTMPENMTKEECQRRLEELEAEADRRGCCVIPATPIPDPDGIPDEGQA